MDLRSEVTREDALDAVAVVQVPLMSSDELCLPLMSSDDL